jgi:hypothetical protein
MVSEERRRRIPFRKPITIVASPPKAVVAIPGFLSLRAFCEAEGVAISTLCHCEASRREAVAISKRLLRRFAPRNDRNVASRYDRLTVIASLRKGGVAIFIHQKFS